MYYRNEIPEYHWIELYHCLGSFTLPGFIHTATQENLKKEIEQLQEQLEHNPFVMRYVVENQSLRAQNKKLKMMEAVRSGEAMAATKAEELETLFLELREGISIL